MLAAARCRRVAEGDWGQRTYLDTEKLEGWDERAVLAGKEGGAAKTASWFTLSYLVSRPWESAKDA